MTGPRKSHLLLAGGLYAFFAVFLLWPLVQMVYVGFRSPSGGLTLDYVKLIFNSPVYARGLLNSTLLALTVTAMTFVVSLPLAILSVKYDFPGRGLVSGLLLVPLVLPPFVGAIGMRLVLGRHGPLAQLLGTSGGAGVDWLGGSGTILGVFDTRLLAIAVIQALGLYPIMLLNVQAALANIDPAMEQAAANLGASRWGVFRRITLPLIRPGLFAGATLVLIWSFTELGTPLMFDFYDITPVQVYKQLSEAESSPLPYALVVVMLAASSGLYLVGKLLLGRGFASATTKASTAAVPKKLTGWKGLAALSPFLVLFALAALPAVSVVLTSITLPGHWYRTVLPDAYTLAHFLDALRDPLIMPSSGGGEIRLGAIGNSLLLASAATLLAVVVGLGCAVVLVRSNVPGKWMIDTLAMLPLAVPGIVLAFGYVGISIFFRRTFPIATAEGGPLAWLNVQENPMVLLALAYAARRLPYVVRSAVAGLQQTPVDLELAGANLGADRWTVLRRITLPLITANLVAGALLAFAFAMLEVSDSLILAQRAQYYPITKAILDLTFRIGSGIYVASALGVWAMALLALTLLSANQLLGKRMGAIFRA